MTGLTSQSTTGAGIILGGVGTITTVLVGIGVGAIIITVTRGGITGIALIGAGEVITDTILTGVTITHIITILIGATVMVIMADTTATAIITVSLPVQTAPEITLPEETKQDCREYAAITETRLDPLPETRGMSARPEMAIWAIQETMSVR